MHFITLPPCCKYFLLERFAADCAIFAVDIDDVAFADAVENNRAAAANRERKFIAAERRLSERAARFAVRF